MTRSVRETKPISFLKHKGALKGRVFSKSNILIYYFFKILCRIICTYYYYRQKEQVVSTSISPFSDGFQSSLVAWGSSDPSAREDV